MKISRLTKGLVASLALLVGIMSGRADYSATILADNPIHYWPLAESATNQAAADLGNPGGNPGTYTDQNNVGGITLGQSVTPTLIGDTCATFSGANGVFVNAGLFHPGDNMTVEAWVKVGTSPGGNIRSVLARWDGSYELDVDQSNFGRLVVENDDGDTAVVSSLTPLIPGQWHHLVGIFDQGVAAVYLDGVLGATNLLGGVLNDLGNNTPDQVLIGNTRNGNTGNGWYGSIAKVAVYNYGLTPQQIQTHYTNGVPNVAPALAQQPAVLVQWPSLPGTFRLQVTSSLSSPNWTTPDASSALTPDGVTLEQVFTPSTLVQFFRSVSTNAVQP
jgi:hypothetical protein